MNKMRYLIFSRLRRTLATLGIYFCYIVTKLAAYFVKEERSKTKQRKNSNNIHYKLTAYMEQMTKAKNPTDNPFFPKEILIGNF